jgi:hypothetical protein
MPRPAVLGLAIRPRDSTSVAALRFAAVMPPICPANGHTTTPVNKKSKALLCLILSPVDVKLFLLTCLLGPE